MFFHVLTDDTRMTLSLSTVKLLLNVIDIQPVAFQHVLQGGPNKKTNHIENAI